MVPDIFMAKSKKPAKDGRPKKIIRPAHWDAIEADFRLEKLEKYPSKVNHAYWVEADKEFSPYPKPTERSGKYTLLLKRTLTQSGTNKKFALENGEFGNYAKVSTNKPNPNSSDPSKHVICVYTYDSADETDVRRIRESLRKLGFVGKLSYKTDNATYAGKYAKTGSKHISLYCE